VRADPEQSLSDLDARGRLRYSGGATNTQSWGFDISPQIAPYASAGGFLGQLNPGAGGFALREERCSKCRKTYPMNSMFTVRGSLTCESCLEQMLMSDGTLERSEIEGHVDPTVCANCGRDNGSSPLGQLASLPACDPCTSYFRNRPFPRWLKFSMALLLVVISLHLVSHRRFWLAYRDLKQAAETEDFLIAAALHASAAQRVPESDDLKAVSSYMTAVTLLDEDRPEEAISHLEQCRGFLPPAFQVERVILVAGCSAAFDSGDYDKLLKISLELKRGYRNEPVEWARAASGYACKYALTGDESYRRNALAHLDSARARAPQDSTLLEYEMRIMHRLHSREIINHDEFYERYPDGWTEGDD
jgi:hypothetical protein